MNSQAPSPTTTTTGATTTPRPQPPPSHDINDPTYLSPSFEELVKRNIYKVKPGLSGIGSIVFRDEEKLLSNSKIPIKEFYAKHISPYKGNLELWYQNNLSFYTDFMIIFLTVWVIFFPKSNLVFKVFNDLPSKPSFLE